jgi:hypothetical protein
MGDEVRSRSISPDSHFNSFQVAAPRTTRKSYRPRVSDRTMVGTLQPPCLSVSDTEWRCHRRKMKPLGWKNKSTCRIMRRVESLGREAGTNPSFITWAGKSENIRPQERYFFLTSPFIELHGTWHGPPTSSREMKASSSECLWKSPSC